MTESGLSDELTAFIARYFSSLRQLEVLLWLHGRAGQPETATTVSKALRCDRDAAAGWLGTFRSDGFLQTDDKDTYRYAPSDPRLTKYLDLLAAEYKLRPLKVIDAVVNRSTHKMLDLMKAFQLKKGDDSDGR